MVAVCGGRHASRVCVAEMAECVRALRVVGWWL